MGQLPRAQDYTSVQELKQALTDAVEGWNRHPTPFIWGGKRHARRDRAYARRHRLAGSGATTTYQVCYLCHSSTHSLCSLLRGHFLRETSLRNCSPVPSIPQGRNFF
ncbi:MAG TPA: hypothetical protein VGL94_18220 [Ktedonobacteraceae bacterium]